MRTVCSFTHHASRITHRTMHIELHVTEGPAQGQHFSFDTPDCFLVGRAADAHISLPDDPYLSRQHFLLLISPPDCTLCELDSKNGVFVNGVRYGGRKPPRKKVKQAPAGVREVALKDGDHIRVGNTRIQVSLQSDSRPDDEYKAPSVLSEKALQQFLSTKGFENIRTLCQGSKGPIYRAIEPEKRRDVIVKAVRFSEDADPQKVRRLQAELELLCHLSHPHIVPLLKYGSCGQCVFCLMPYVEGSDLEELLRNYDNGMPLPEAAAIMLDLLDGLAYAHTRTVRARASRGASKSFRGIVYRDLKPRNIFLTCDGNVWIPRLADFGLSRGFEIAGLTNITHPAEIGSAPLYWPREQVTHYTRPTLATDVFALAAIFYRMLTGCWIRDGFQELFTGPDSQGIQPSLTEYLRIIVKHAPIPIRERNPQIPEPLSTVIDRALQEEELSHDTTTMQRRLDELRYPDANAFQKAIISAFQKIGLKPLPLTSRNFSILQSQQSPTPLFEKNTEPEATSAGTIIYSTLRASQKREVALFVLDVAHSTQHILEMGDTHFGSLIRQIFRRIKQHPSALELIFLKCTGDGFLGVFHSMTAALSTAISLLNNPIVPTVRVRIALHWGTVRTGPNGDVLGTEIHKVCRMEGVKITDLLEPMIDKKAFPTENRILISKQGFVQLPEAVHGKFKQMGKFYLKGFHKLHELWLYSEKPGH